MKPARRPFRTGDTIGWSVVDWTGAPLIHRKTRRAARDWIAANFGKYSGMRTTRQVLTK